MRSKWVAGILYTVTAVQFIIGSYMLIYSAVEPGQCLLSVTYAPQAAERRKYGLEQLPFLRFLWIRITYVFQFFQKSLQ